MIWGVVSLQGFWIIKMSLSAASGFICIHCYCPEFEIKSHIINFYCLWSVRLIFQRVEETLEYVRCKSCPDLCLYLHIQSIQCISPGASLWHSPSLERFLSTPFSFYPLSLYFSLHCCATKLGASCLFKEDNLTSFAFFLGKCLFYIFRHPQFDHDGGERPSSVLLWCGAQPGAR